MNDKLRSLENVNYRVAMSESFIGKKYNYGWRADVEDCSIGTCLSYVFCVDRMKTTESNSGSMFYVADNK